jgi:hypothetical protein
VYFRFFRVRGLGGDTCVAATSGPRFLNPRVCWQESNHRGLPLHLSPASRLRLRLVIMYHPLGTPDISSVSSGHPTTVE